MKRKVSPSAVHRRKLIILLCGVLLSFFTAMCKMLVPGPIYSNLQSELSFSPALIAGLGAAFMYTYAVSQLLAGVFSKRYGGVRILLIGGGVFTIGFLCFPLCSTPWILYLCRLIAGFGAGTTFVGVVKLLGDLFPEKFGLALGLALFVGYLGPAAGTVPMVWLISVAGWRNAYLLPALICAAAMVLILCFMKGTVKKNVPGETFAPLWKILGNRSMWLLCISSSLLFGIFYILLIQIGQKCLEDFYSLSKYKASLCITGMTLLIAVNNVLINWILKFFGGRRKPVICTGAFLSLTGSLIGCGAFLWHWPLFFMLAAFLFITLPAGFFSLYGMAGKELNPPELTGLAVAMVNFSAFVFIALWGNISGFILSFWQSSGNVFPGEAYAALFGFMAISGLCAFALTLFLRETGPSGKEITWRVYKETQTVSLTSKTPFGQ